MAISGHTPRSRHAQCCILDFYAEHKTKQVKRLEPMDAYSYEFSVSKATVRSGSTVCGVPHQPLSSELFAFLQTGDAAHTVGDCLLPLEGRNSQGELGELGFRCTTPAGIM